MRFLLVSLFFLSFFAARAQDSLEVVEEIDSSQLYVRKAVMFSAILPGSGQILNHINMPKGKKKAFWKVPLIYAGLGFTMYSIINNNSQRIRLRDEYNFRNDNTGSLYPEYSIYDQTGVLTIHNQKQNFRDLSILGFTAIYLLQVIDAGVEAHFVNFDISEDLSMNITPTLFNRQTLGLGVTFNFR